MTLGSSLENVTRFEIFLIIYLISTLDLVIDIWETNILSHEKGPCTESALLISGVKEEILKHVIMTSPYLITKSHKKVIYFSQGPFRGDFICWGVCLWVLHIFPEAPHVSNCAVHAIALKVRNAVIFLRHLYPFPWFPHIQFFTIGNSFCLVKFFIMRLPFLHFFFPSLQSRWTLFFLLQYPLVTSRCSILVLLSIHSLLVNI